ncbi:MBL fold metallo-hydrolase [Undibacterium sp. RuRC25W]|uniref:MBL fold metallo-hydrolase n=1 Tax=Undibacterium sp. RuRC25W TaxID=3413047 RepID=UPI003BF2A3A0
MGDAQFQLPVGMHLFERGWLSSNNILFVSDTGTALVDSGYVRHAPQTLALVQHALQGQSLDLLVNTHLHSDHCGGNALLQQTYACKTLIPSADMPLVERWDETQLSFDGTGQECPRFTADLGLQEGQLLQLGHLSWQVLGAPGHDPHSVVLYCAQEGLLISADALWENGFGVIFPELEGESGFAEQAAILQLIEELDIRLVIPGHGAAFTDKQAAIDRARSRLDYLAADTKRNARNAIKVLIAFMLLDKREITVSQLSHYLTSVRMMRIAVEQLAVPATTLLPQLIQELIKAGAARLEGERLLST